MHHLKARASHGFTKLNHYKEKLKLNIMLVFLLFLLNFALHIHRRASFFKLLGLFSLHLARMQSA